MDRLLRAVSAEQAREVEKHKTELHARCSPSRRGSRPAAPDPVVEFQTNFGGDKTHSMLALYHLFSDVTAADLTLDKFQRTRGVVVVGQRLGLGRSDATVGVNGATQALDLAEELVGGGDGGRRGSRSYSGGHSDQNAVCSSYSLWGLVRSSCIPAVP